MGDKLQNENLLAAMWGQYSKVPFDSWVQNVSNVYFESGLTLESGSRLAGARCAEFLAVLQLATLDNKDLEKISEHNPPRTTWIALAKANSETIDLCLSELSNNQNRKSAVELISQIVRSQSAKGNYDKVSKIPGSVIVHFARKAQEYKSLNEKHQKALMSFGKSKSTGKILSAGQQKYLSDLLQTLIGDNVISRKSKDGDQEFCDLVLEALT